MIEEWLQSGGHLAPRALAAEAPHLGEDEPLGLGKTLPECAKTAVGPGDIRTAVVSVTREKNQSHVPSLPAEDTESRTWAASATEMILVRLV